MRRAPALLAPALLLPIAATLALARHLPDSLATALDAAPLIVFASGAVLGIVTRRGRLLVGVIILALADCALINIGSRTVFDAVALLLPLNFAVIVWLGEKNPLVGPGAALFGVTLLQAAVVGMLQHPELASVVTSLERPIVNTGLRWTAVPQLAVFAFAAALGLAATRFLLHRHSLAAGAAWALVASFIALDGISAGGSSSIHFAAAGLLLVVGATAEPHYVARRDEVTRLPTRLEFNRTLRELPRRYALAWVEIDEFQRFRQDHGRDAARLMLRQVARTLAKVRGGGEAFSYDGHIFTVVFPRTSAKAAAHHLDAVRRIVEAADLNLSLPAPERPGQAQKTRPGLIQRTVSVTITVGVAEPTAPDADPREVLRAAEQAMQNARHAGMNRVGLARDEAPALG